MEYIKEPVVEQCEGCGKSFSHNDVAICSVYLVPESKWRNNMNCPMATHIKKDVKKDDFKLNPLKASKRGSK
jgi:hypothetical protein